MCSCVIDFQNKQLENYNNSPDKIGNAKSVSIVNSQWVVEPFFNLITTINFVIKGNKTNGTGVFQEKRYIHAKYCPFCGVKYEPQKAEQNQVA